jgi:diacylglycerol kinase family enzyme
MGIEADPRAAARQSAASAGAHSPQAFRQEPRRRFLLVHNPTAGIIGDRLVRSVVARLEARGATVEAARPSRHDAGPLENTDGFDAVIAAGGDGTIRALAARAGDLPLGIIPAGTGNVLASEIGLPRRAEAIAEILARGPVVDIVGARANGAPFFVMAGAGFDGAVVRALDVGLKRLIGKAAYALPILRALATRPEPLSVTIDGVPHAARWLVVTKARRYGGSFVISSSAGVLKPGLTAVLFTSTSRFMLLRQLLALVAGTLEREPGVAIIRCRHVTVTSSVPVPVQIDGDEFAVSPLLVEADGPRLRLIVPPDFPASQSVPPA